RAEDVDLDGHAGGVLGGDVRIRDRLPERVPIAAAGDAPLHVAFYPHRLRAERDRTGLVQDEACEPGLGRRLTLLEKRGAADEVALVELHAETQPRLIRIHVGRDVGAPYAVSLLQSQRVDRPVPAGREPVNM